MKRIVLGFCILATLLVSPVSAAVVNNWHAVLRMPDYMVPLSKVLIAMVVGCIGAAIFLRQSRLRARLAPQPKGAAFMLCGALLYVGIPLIVASSRYGHRGDVLDFIVAHSLTLYPAFLMLVAGAARVFLNLKPAA